MRVGQYGLRQPHHLAVRGIRGQYVGPHGTDILRETHHQLLADGVDGRVRHLCKLLAEIVEQHLRAVADDGQRRVVTHGGNRLLTGRSHGDDGLVDVLLSEAKRQQPALQVAHAVVHVPPALQLLQLHAVLTEPLAVGVRLGQLLLQLTVVPYLSLLRVDEQNLARLQPPLAHHVARLKIHDAHLRGHHHQALPGNGVTAGAQPVPVKHAAGIAAVAEQQGGRTVPRLHQDGVVLVERLQVFADGVLVVEALRHQYGYCLRQRESAHHEKLKHVVQRSRVAHAFLHDGAQATDVA